MDGKEVRINTKVEVVVDKTCNCKDGEIHVKTDIVVEPHQRGNGK